MPIISRWQGYKCCSVSKEETINTTDLLISLLQAYALAHLYCRAFSKLRWFVIKNLIKLLAELSLLLFVIYNVYRKQRGKAKFFSVANQAQRDKKFSVMLSNVIIKKHFYLSLNQNLTFLPCSQKLLHIIQRRIPGLTWPGLAHCISEAKGWWWKSVYKNL